MPRYSLRLMLVAFGVLITAGVSGCAAATPTAAGASSRLPVVAAENFYGDLVGQIGGAHVAVTSILANPNSDPHLFQPGTRTELAVASARVVVANGAGYDDWISKLLAATPSSKRQLVDVSAVLGVSGSDANPHLWYDTPALPRVVTAIGNALARADPSQAGAFHAGVRRTIERLRPLLDAVRRLKARFAGAPVAYTERVPGLMLAAAGLRVLTPASFARAVEDGTDPTPADVAAMQHLLTARAVKVLLYNEQATSPLTVRLRLTARAAGVPVVPVTETEPAHTTFAAWQLTQVRTLTAALAR